jgi:UbiD family decarboxylase|tara:strand:- start:2054 stop:3505 length:1452 start_codon:yes stop_codon:yes gene_type:complete
MPPEPFTSLRDHIDAIESAGLLQHINNAHWDLEIGAITEQVAFSGNPRALLFDSIVDYNPGFRVATNLHVSRDLQALALGMPLGVSGVDLVKDWRSRTSKLERLPPLEVNDGPIRENVLTGGDIDLFSFPAPQWRAPDGGRYIGTGDVTFTTDIEGGWVNAAPYRAQLFGPKRMTIEIAETHHGKQHLKSFWEAGEHAPIVMVAGQDPYTYAGACTPLPAGYPELEYAGGLMGKPIEVITHKETGLPIPATAEIAVIGFVPPLDEDSEDEGPFGECTGYFTHGGLHPVVNVTEIWHRNNPILQGNPTMHGSAMRHALGAEILTSSRMWDAIENEIPNIQGVYAIYQQCQQGAHITAVSIKQTYDGHAKQTATSIAGSLANGTLSRAVIVVDEDIDPSDWEDVLFAFSTRCDPYEDIDIVRGMPNSHLDPRIPPDLKKQGVRTTSTMLINACKPYHWKDQFPQTNSVDNSLKQEMVDKFNLNDW